MQRRLHGESKKAAKLLRSVIREYDAEPDNRDKFYLVYRGMRRFVEEVKELQEDLSLE